MRQFLFLLSLVLLAGCGASRQALSGDVPQFSRDVLPLLQKFQPLQRTEPGLRLDSWDALIAGSEQGGVLIPFDADRSLLVQWAENASEGQAVFTEAEAATLRAWIEAGAKNDAGRVPYADAQNLLYVTNQGEATVSVVDMDANLVIRVVDLEKLGFSRNAKPHHIAVEPDGRHWYVSLIGENRVLKFNRNNEIVGQAPFEVPGMLALAPDGDRLFVGRSMSAVNPPMSIGVVRPSDMALLEEVDVFFPRPHALVATPSGEKVYSASLAVNQIAVVDVAEEDVNVLSIPGGTHTFVQFALSPDGRTLATTGQISGQVLFFDLTQGEQPVLTDSLFVGSMPWHPMYSPDGRFLYFGNKMSNAVTIIDAQARAVVATVEGTGLAQPHGAAVRPDGRYLYVSNNNMNYHWTPRYAWHRPPGPPESGSGHEGHGGHVGHGGMAGDNHMGTGDGHTPGTLVVIDTQAQRVVKVLEVGNNPTGVGARPAR